MMHILPCDALQRHRSCDTYPRISPERPKPLHKPLHTPVAPRCTAAEFPRRHSLRSARCHAMQGHDPTPPMRRLHATHLRSPAQPALLQQALSGPGCLETCP